MNIQDEVLDLLLEDIAKKIATSVVQPRDAILREAHRRLHIDSTDIAAIHVIAAARIQNRQPDRSLRLLQQHELALENDATGHRLAGYAFLLQQQVTRARSHFLTAIRLDPRLHDCWTWLGRIDQQRGLIREAAEFYERAIYFEDFRHEAALALSRLYARNRRLTRAIATLRSVLRRDKRSGSLNAALAKLQIQRSNNLLRKRKIRAATSVLNRALRCMHTSIAAEPSAEKYKTLGRIQQGLGNFTEAASAFSKAVQMDDRCPVAITHLANHAVEMGDMDDALKLYRKALEVSPEFAPAHFKFSRAQRFKPETPTLQYAGKLSQLVSDQDRRPREQIQLNFALAKVLDDIGQYDRAWEHYDRANRLKTRHSESVRPKPGRAGEREPTVPLQRIVDASVEMFTPEFFSSQEEIGNPSVTPVFIVGMPRSGTTLTEQILSSHPDVMGAGELKEIERIRHRLVVHAAAKSNHSESAYPSMLETIDNQLLRDLAMTHVDFLDQMRGDAKYVSDKMPTNFMHLGLIAILFPNAKIIHCRRDPMDVLVSCYCQNLSAPFCDLDALALYHQQYRRLMTHWQQVLPLEIYSTDYEALVSDPETNSRRLVESCGLDWNDSCLNFHTNDRAVHTPSKWQVRQPMYQTSIAKWKRFEAHLSPIVELVNQDYEPTSLCSSSEFQSSVA